MWHRGKNESTRFKSFFSCGPYGRSGEKYGKSHNGSIAFNAGRKHTGGQAKNSSDHRQCYLYNARNLFIILPELFPIFSRNFRYERKRKNKGHNETKADLQPGKPPILF